MTERIPMAPVPADIRVCFNRLVPTPPPGEMTQAQVVRLITRLRASEVGKSRCGKRILRLYDQHAEMAAY